MRALERGTRSPKSARLARACSSTSGSWSTPKSRVRGKCSSSARACPPAPTVPSTIQPESSAPSGPRRLSSTSPRRTGTCTLLDSLDMLPPVAIMGSFPPRLVLPSARPAAADEHDIESVEVVVVLRLELLPLRAVPDLRAVRDADHHDFLVDLGVLAQLLGEEHAPRAVERRHVHIREEEPLHGPQLCAAERLGGESLEDLLVPL